MLGRKDGYRAEGIAWKEKRRDIIIYARPTSCSAFPAPTIDYRGRKAMDLTSCPDFDMPAPLRTAAG